MSLIPNAITDLTSRNNLNKPDNHSLGGDLTTGGLLGSNLTNPFLPTQTGEPLIRLASDEGQYYPEGVKTKNYMNVGDLDEGGVYKQYIGTSTFYGTPPKDDSTTQVTAPINNGPTEADDTSSDVPYDDSYYVPNVSEFTLGDGTVFYGSPIKVDPTPDLDVNESTESSISFNKPHPVTTAVTHHVPSEVGVGTSTNYRNNETIHYGERSPNSNQSYMAGTPLVDRDTSPHEPIRIRDSGRIGNIQEYSDTGATYTTNNWEWRQHLFVGHNYLHQFVGHDIETTENKSMGGVPGTVITDYVNTYQLDGGDLAFINNSRTTFYGTNTDKPPQFGGGITTNYDNNEPGGVVLHDDRKNRTNHNDSFMTGTPTPSYKVDQYGNRPHFGGGSTILWADYAPVPTIETTTDSGDQ